MYKPEVLEKMAHDRCRAIMRTKACSKACAPCIYLAAEWLTAAPLEDIARAALDSAIETADLPSGNRIRRIDPAAIVASVVGSSDG